MGEREIYTLLGLLSYLFASRPTYLLLIGTFRNKLQRRLNENMIFEYDMVCYMMICLGLCWEEFHSSDLELDLVWTIACYWKTTSAGWMALLGLARLVESRDPVNKHGLTIITAWMTNHMHYKLWVKFIYPFPNFGGAGNGQVISSHIYRECDDLSMLWLKLMLVKRAHGYD